jgi:hypothetical protein
VKPQGRLKTLKRAIRKLIGRDWERFEPQVRPPAETQSLSLEIFSTYCHNVPEHVRKMQANVFQHFGLPLTQVEFGDEQANDRVLHRGHGETIEHLIRGSSADLLMFFDVDCIPLSRAVVENCYVPVMLAGGLIGPAQRANHIDDFVYAAPAAIGFARRLYERAGRPALRPSKKFDVCASFSRACELRGHPVVKLPPVSCVRPKWSLYDDRFHHVGHGTTFAGGIFHAFEIRLGSTQELFLRKCEEVLGSTPSCPTRLQSVQCSAHSGVTFE